MARRFGRRKRGGKVRAFLAHSVKEGETGEDILGAWVYCEGMHNFASGGFIVFGYAVHDALRADQSTPTIGGTAWIIYGTTMSRLTKHGQRTRTINFAYEKGIVVIMLLPRLTNRSSRVMK